MGSSVPSGLVDLKAKGQEIEATHNAESRALVSHETKPLCCKILICPASLMTKNIHDIVVIQEVGCLVIDNINQKS